MIKSFFKAIRRSILVLIILLFVTIPVDYKRLVNGKVPLFNISKYDKKTKIETYYGFFYKSTREINQSIEEPLTESTNITFKVFNKNCKIPKQKSIRLDYTVTVQNIPNCEENSKLYFADKNIKVYTYCLSSIKLKESSKTKSEDLLSYLNKDYKIVEDLKNKFSYVGLNEDTTTEVYKTLDNAFVSKQLVIYQCNKKNINDFYIAPLGTPMQEDFCTYKDDDWDFLWEVREEPYAGEEDFVPDLFYEDDVNLYELSITNKENVYLVSPAVRGREERRIPMLEAFLSGRVSLDELKERGMHFDVVNKEERAKEIREKEEAERKKAEEEAKKAEEEAKKAEEEAQKAAEEASQANQNQEGVE